MVVHWAVIHVLVQTSRVALMVLIATESGKRDNFSSRAFVVLKFVLTTEWDSEHFAIYAQFFSVVLTSFVVRWVWSAVQWWDTVFFVGIYRWRSPLLLWILHWWSSTCSSSSGVWCEQQNLSHTREQGIGQWSLLHRTSLPL